MFGSSSSKLSCDLHSAESVFMALYNPHAWMGCCLELWEGLKIGGEVVRHRFPLILHI